MVLGTAHKKPLAAHLVTAEIDIIRASA